MSSINRNNEIERIDILALGALLITPTLIAVYYLYNLHINIVFTGWFFGGLIFFIGVVWWLILLKYLSFK